MVVWNLSVIVDCAMISAYHNESHCSRTLHYQSISAASPPFSKTMHTLRPGCQVAAARCLAEPLVLPLPVAANRQTPGWRAGKPEGLPIAPIPQQRLRMKFGQLIFASLHARRGGKCRFPRQGKTGGVVRGRNVPAGLSRAARLWRHPTGGRLGVVPRAARLWAGFRGMQSLELDS